MIRCVVLIIFHWLLFWFIFFGICVEIWSALTHLIDHILEWIDSLVTCCQFLGILHTFLEHIVFFELIEPLFWILTQLIKEIVAELLILVFCLFEVCTELYLTLPEGDVEVGDVEAEALQLLWILFQNVSHLEWELLEFSLEVLKLYVEHRLNHHLFHFFFITIALDFQVRHLEVLGRDGKLLRDWIHVITGNFKFKYHSDVDFTCLFPLLAWLLNQNSHWQIHLNLPVTILINVNTGHLGVGEPTLEKFMRWR
jgi:hypothetical protein